MLSRLAGSICASRTSSQSLNLWRRTSGLTSIRYTGAASMHTVAAQSAEQHYDLIVIGSGPAGQKCAIAAAKNKKKVAIVDKSAWVGGVCVHTGTIPSKTLREAILYLTGFRQRSFYGRNYTAKDHISVTDLAYRVQTVENREREMILGQLTRNGVEMINGHGTFKNQRELEVNNDIDEPRVYTADNYLISTGTSPAHNPSVTVDGRHIVDADMLMDGLFYAGSEDVLPRSIIVVGAGVIGIEYAAMLSSFSGVDVMVVDGRKEVLGFIDREIIDTLTYHLRSTNKVEMHLGEAVKGCTINRGVVAHLESGKNLAADALLYAVGRYANTDGLSLSACGIKTDKRGYIEVDRTTFQTEVPHIYAAGDVIGFPALASTSWEQGRVAAAHMFGEECVQYNPDLMPYGIYTIPEISTIGKNEQELTEAKIPYVVGKAHYSDLAKGQMIGDEDGLLKILFDPVSLKILGVHCIGENACEIIHIGVMAMATDATVEVFRDTVFNFPTLAEAYKVAALDGLNRVAKIKRRMTAPIGGSLGGLH
eukprot:GFYU01003508.1.p1 GENE.GFYU01003508.1~~GFYU01003508.1.p1  ORF type:complete len:536 (-),score=117.71 GFYU01003508.1:768-2375(-)